MNPSTDNISQELMRLRNRNEATKVAAAEQLHGGGGGGTSGTMDDNHNVKERLARLEGGNGMLQLTLGIVSAALLAAMGLMLAVLLSTQQQVAVVSAKVDALPSEINAQILTLTTSFAEVIAASRAPNVIEVVPGAAEDLDLREPEPSN